MIRQTALAILVALAAPAAAERGVAPNGLAVQGSGTEIEVFARAGKHGQDYFCAAGSFARRHLNARATDRVEISSGLGPSRTRPGQRSMVFELRPRGTNRSQGLDLVLLRPKSVGSSRSVAHANSLCYPVQGEGADDD